jgi:glycyl-tRNA synthetase (class II)
MNIDLDAIMMHPKPEASGHVDTFNDPLVDSKASKTVSG